MVFSFQKGHFNVNHSARSGELCDFNRDRLKTLNLNKPRQLASMMNCESTTVRYFNTMGKFQNWVR